MTTPPQARPSIVSVNGSDAAARATPNSACTIGSATTTDHMPTPPTVDTSMVAPRRSHAWRKVGARLIRSFRCGESLHRATFTAAGSSVNPASLFIIVIASGAERSKPVRRDKAGLLRRHAPRNDARA